MSSSSTTSSSLNALVFGASGITGWGIARAALSYPTPQTFSQVIALTNRPLVKENSFLPTNRRLALHSGVDLSKDVNSIVESLKNIPNIEKTTHVYFSAYIHSGWGTDGASQRKINVDLLVNAVKAVEIVCPDLQFWTYQSGGKWYGFEFGAHIEWETPLKESAPRITGDYGDTIFYYPQFDALTALSRGKKWAFADIRPDAIIGFVPNHNPMNLAEPMGIFLSLWAFLNPDKPVPFPGTATSWTAVHSDIGQSLLGRFTIFASLPENKARTQGKSFNIADNDGNTWESLWPGICAYFGLKGVGPLPESDSANLTGESWVLAQKSHWDDFILKNGLKKGTIEGGGYNFITVVMGPYSEKDRQFDKTESRKLGFLEDADHVKSYYEAFDQMRLAKIIA